MMRQILATTLTLLIGLLPNYSFSQDKTIFDEPYSFMFDNIQRDSIFPNQQMFADASPKKPLKKIWKKFKKAKAKGHLDLKEFTLKYFEVPQPDSSTFTSDKSLPTEEHMAKLWDILTKEIAIEDGKLPNPHVVQSGTADCYDYAGDYFTMLGLVASEKIELVKNMVNNYAFLIDKYGFVPYGNRSYQKTHTQPPYFSLMVRLLANHDTTVRIEDYLIQMEKEYNFWMEDSELLSNLESARKRVVLMPHGEIMNRYWDATQKPRPEFYAEDARIASEAEYDSLSKFQNLRAAHESGWQYSSRWLGYTNSFATINTMELIPVDLNCLLYHLELTIAESYQHKNDGDKYEDFAIAADYRKTAIIKYCWTEEKQFFMDYSFIDQYHSDVVSLAGLFPLFFEIASSDQILPIVSKLETEFLKEGGLLTSLRETGEVWDAPNAYAPLQYIVIKGLKNYDYSGLADDVVYRWLTLTDEVFQNTGKILDRYHADSAKKEAVGGAYPYQDGYGWSSGVYLWLLSGEE